MRTHTTVSVREPAAQDGAAVWELVRRAGTLDLNSAYCYLLLCDRFRDTCAVAEQEGQIVGFVSAFFSKDRPDTLFVWQIAVDGAMRGQGIGAALLRGIVERPECRSRTRWVEATVSPSNLASNRLFQRFAEERQAALTAADGGYEAKLFPAGAAHEDEPLLRIGPLR
jgi:L-2,4-diaminobutyric acid acetyltransferase